MRGVVGLSWGIAGYWYGNYGFITDQYLRPGEESVFVYFRDIEDDGFRELRTGEVVKYLLVENEKRGLKALQVRVLCLASESGPYLADKKWQAEFAEEA